jgi:hypothetical protein
VINKFIGNKSISTPFLTDTWLLSDRANFSCSVSEMTRLILVWKSCKGLGHVDHNASQGSH